MHGLLRRQLKKAGLEMFEHENIQFKQFIETVNQAYKDNDRDRVALEVALEVASEEMRALYKKQQEISRHDALTGLSNRYHFESVLSIQAIKQAKNQHTKFAVCMLDLDHFKCVNDTFGHDTGDQLLKEATQRIQNELDNTDFFIRLGGDEFLIIMNNIYSINEVTHKTENIVSIMRQVFSINKNSLKVSTSIGVSLFPDDAQDINTLMKQADLAMYQVKADGKDNYCFYHSSMQKVEASKCSAR